LLLGVPAGRLLVEMIIGRSRLSLDGRRLIGTFPKKRQATASLYARRRDRRRPSSLRVVLRVRRPLIQPSPRFLLTTITDARTLTRSPARAQWPLARCS